MSAVLAFALLMASPARAEIRALVVAVGHYSQAGIQSLDGPPNDAQAALELLKQQGSTDVVVLQDAQATRTSIRAALKGLGERAKPGDWVVFFYAGHGAQAKARGNDEADGLDEFLVLSGFHVIKPDTEQFILDDELHGWLVNFFPRTVNVLQIADACHSGTLNRAPRSESRFKSRQALNTPLGIPLPQTPPDPSAIAPAGDARNLVYIGAAQDDQLAIEGPLPRADSPSHGLLTYALEETLKERRADGKLVADRNGDGQLSLAELASTLRLKTRELSSTQQWSSAVLPPGNERTVIFKPLNAPDDDPPLRVQGADAEAKEILAGKGPWASIVQGQADFVWSARGGWVTDAHGDRIAESVVSAGAMAAIIGKHQALAAIYRVSQEDVVTMQIGPLKPGQMYRDGAPVDLTVLSSGAAGYLTVFDVAGDGTVQAVFPLDGDGEGRLAGDRTKIASLHVAPPFGVDHVVAVVTKAPPKVLREAITRVNGKRQPLAIAAAVQDEVTASAGGLVAVGELYTGP